MTLLLLSGTREGQEAAAELARRRVAAVVSLAGGARIAEGADLPVRLGGFGGDAGFAEYLRREEIRAVLDATHPFAARVSARSARICAELGVPYCLLERPPWQAAAGDRWTEIAREEEAAVHIPAGATVFLATGRGTLERFANLSDCELICRQIEPPSGEFPFKNGRYLVGKPPFSVEEEKTLFTELGVDWLVVKNAGGAASATKLEAARALGLPVAMIARPAPPEGALRVRTVAEALAWVAAL